MKRYRIFKNKRTKYHPSIQINVYVSLIKEQRKNGGKLLNKALTRNGHTPSKSIKTNQKEKGK